MTKYARRSAALALALAVNAAPAVAQTIRADAHVSTDERRRGLSWSDGDVSPSAQVSLPVGGFDLAVAATGLRGSARHGGADAVADVDLSYRLMQGGGLTLRAIGSGHVFFGARGPQSYGELGADLDYLIGPAQLTGGVRYAPDQTAIGGDNLYLFAEASGGIPLTPISVRAGVGRSSGTTDDPLRAARLRPEGGAAYSDWWLGVTHVTGPLSIGATFSDTDVDRRRVTAPLGDARHTGGKLVGRIGVSF